ncbi:MAG: class I SAM-dependent methyltransferase [Thiotrichaceae bacterium]|nr:class I SAM-dependent methyltransferase [Thiotrichaceae bacterium]
MKENKASSTAFSVLQSILYLAQHPRYSDLVPKEMVEASQRMLSTSDEGKKCLRQLESRWYSSLILPAMIRLLMPGVAFHCLLRKRFIEDNTHDAIAGGVTQVINLGAGFDTLAWRIHEQYPKVQFIEIDHPATLALKAKAIPKQSLSNLHLLAVDFSKQNLEEALKSLAAFDPESPTLFICEAVFMYLEKDEVIQIIKDIKCLTGKGTRLVFTCMEPASSTRNNIGPLFNIYLKIKGEPFKWPIESENLQAFFGKDYKVQEIATTETLRTHYFSTKYQDQLHQGEYLAVAEIV